MNGDYYTGPERRSIAAHPPDFSSIAIGAVAIIGFTMMLLALGGALGVNVPGDAAAGAIATEFGTWAVFSAVIGTALGCMVGGLVCARHTLSSAVAHGLGAIGAAVVFSALLGVLGVPGMLGSAMTFAATDIGTAATTAIGWGGWALLVGLAASFLVAPLGWVAGLAMRPHASKEMRVEEHHFVRPRRVPESDEVSGRSRL